MFTWVLATFWMVRWGTAIWCEPDFFYIWVSHLGVSAKKSGWQIALTFLLPFFVKEKSKLRRRERLF